MSKLFKIAIVIILLALLFPPYLPAQEGRGDGRVGGTVKDKEGNPIPEAKVTLKILSGVSSGARKMLGGSLSTSFEAQGKSTEKVVEGFYLETLSDKKGRWGIFGFATGEFKLTAEKEGYAPIEQIVRLTQMRRNPLYHIVLSTPDQTPEGKKENPSGNKLKMGNALFAEGKYEEALPYFEEYVKKNPEQYRMGVNLGNCYMALKKFDEAIKTFNTVIEGFQKENPNLTGNEIVATIYANIGEAYSNLNNLEQASVYYKKSMEILPPTDSLRSRSSKRNTSLSR